jgi:threonylcarbamoyladenosine tRNA methylthiotransferase MtaB
MPHACIGVDVIVGFPGETDADFMETYNFLNELNISYLHVFPYSERANTIAVDLPGTVPQKERNRRADMLRILSEKKKRLFYEQHLGFQTTVLFEADIHNGLMEGFTENYIRVVAKYDPLLVNETKFVRLTQINEQGLMEAEEVYQEVLQH